MIGFVLSRRGAFTFLRQRAQLEGGTQNKVDCRLIIKDKREVVTATPNQIAEGSENHLPT